MVVLCVVYQWNTSAAGDIAVAVLVFLTCLGRPSELSTRTHGEFRTLHLHLHRREGKLDHHSHCCSFIQEEIASVCVALASAAANYTFVLGCVVVVGYFARWRNCGQRDLYF